MGGMVTLLVRDKVDLARLGYYQPLPWDQPPSGGQCYKIAQLKKGKMIHPVMRDGEECGYLFEFGPTGAEQYIKLPLPTSFGVPTTFRLPLANLIGLQIVGTSARMALQRQREQIEQHEQEAAEERAQLGGIQVYMEQQQPQAQQPGLDDWQSRL